MDAGFKIPDLENPYGWVIMGPIVLNWDTMRTANFLSILQSFDNLTLCVEGGGRAA